MKQHNNIIIVGSGLAALSTAARLTELGKQDISIYALGDGATPYIAAINFVLEDNPYNDTPKQYAEDMMNAGYNINNRILVDLMCNSTVEGYQLLKRWGVKFATEKDKSIKLRHASGSTYPRSLCLTTRLIGEEMINKLTKGLIEQGIEFHTGCECLKILVKNNKVHGITIKNAEGQIQNVYAPIVIAAWGGVGNLFYDSTYPNDICGRTIAIAYEAGAQLVDMEFLEYEPMVVISPDSAKGEPCPTAMLGEGAYLLNSDMERFILNDRPQGEAGAPKTFLNKSIWHQIQIGKGSSNGGVYVDLRHIPKQTLQSYPWFYNRMVSAGVDPSEELIEVGPMAHSLSGGILVDENLQSSIEGLYAVGEAAGSFHGACRLGGNAASQAVLTGLLCAEAIAKEEDIYISEDDFSMLIDYRVNKKVYEKYVPQIKKLASKGLGILRNGKDLAEAQKTLQEMLLDFQLRSDTATYQTALSAFIMVTAALERKESRGCHIRADYPHMDKGFEKQIILSKLPNGEISIS
ncbi:MULTISPECIES: FAD-binding protein [Tepidanaerobacter]|uniref:FAD-binding protein n=1 Tax=Tepidanaerobacter TaxID=499228 RepID=UPI000AE932C7|nr:MULTISPECIES: FAD-binding protein [Tepidanaerobacter]